MSHKSVLQERFSMGAIVAGLLVALIGGGHLVAWLAGTMPQLGALHITMKTNAALNLFLTGLALVIITKNKTSKGWTWAARAGSIIVLTIAVLTLLEHLSGWNPGIDQLLATEPPGALAVHSPNRMGLTATLCFIFIGAGLLILSVRDGRGLRVAQTFGVLAAMISLLAVLVHLYQMQELFVLERSIAIAWPTALALLLLGLGLLCAKPEGGFMAQVTAADFGGRMLRRLLVPTIGLLIILGWLRLWGERSGLYATPLGTALLVFAFSITFSGFLFLTAKNISRVTRSEREAQDAVKRQAKLIDLTPAAIIVRQFDGTVSFWSHGAKLLYGWSQEEAIGKRTHELLKTEFPEPLEKMVAKMRQVGQWSGELRHHTKDGRELVVQSWWQAQFAPEGTLAELMESSVDITELKRTEEALRKSEKRYRSLFESIDEGFCVLEMLFDQNGKPNDWRYLEVNPAFERHNGLTQAAGKTMREMVPNIESRWLDIYGKVALTGEAIRFVEPSQALNRWFDLYAFKVGAPEERKVAVLFNNITNRKKAEEALRQSNEELERKVQERTAKLQESVGELEHFSYTITHDMRAPLRAMRSFGEMLLQQHRSCLNPTGCDLLRRISDSAIRMDHLITDALNYSRVVQQKLELEAVDASALLRGIVESYPQLQPPHAEIILEENMPRVLGNTSGMTQCFSNLLDNAVKFVEPGKMPQVRVWAERRGKFARFWFEDNGIGIDPEYHDKIFEMFQRLSQSYLGTGIGLALVRKVVERMKGSVGVESLPGKGSRFWIELKYTDQPAVGYGEHSCALCGG